MSYATDKHQVDGEMHERFWPVAESQMKAPSPHDQDRLERTTVDGDEVLVRRVVAGDGQAFETVMRRHNRRLYRLARAALRDDSEAEDALQEAYLAAYRNMGQFRGESALSTWLSRLVLNACAERQRKAFRRERIVTIVAIDDLAAGDELPDRNDQEAPDTARYRSEMRDLIERKLNTLPESFRIVFVLRSVEELTVHETAECLGVSEETVRSRHFRARSMLRDALAREIGGAECDVFDFGAERCDRVVEGVLTRLPLQEGNPPLLRKERDMRTPASIGNHPIHPMLIVFPVGLLIFSLVCDLIGVTRDAVQPWTTVSFYAMAGGVVGALAAAVPGLIDLLSLPGGSVRRIGFTHMAINLLVVAVFAINLWLRYGGREVAGAPLALSVVGVVLLAISGWLGAELVHTHRVGVAEESASPGVPSPSRPAEGTASMHKART